MSDEQAPPAWDEVEDEVRGWIEQAKRELCKPGVDHDRSQLLRGEIVGLERVLTLEASILAVRGELDSRERY